MRYIFHCELPALFHRQWAKEKLEGTLVFVALLGIYFCLVNAAYTLSMSTCLTFFIKILMVRWVTERVQIHKGKRTGKEK